MGGKPTRHTSTHDSKHEAESYFGGALAATSGERPCKVFVENEPHSDAHHQRSLMEKVKVGTAAAEKLLVETLSGLSSEELQEFKSLLELEESFPLASKRRLKVSSTENLVELMTELYSRQNVEVTRRVLEKMEQTELVNRLSSFTQEQRWPPWIQRVEEMVSVTDQLLNKLADLNGEKIRDLMRHIYYKVLHQSRYSAMTDVTDSEEAAFVLVQVYGQQTLRKIQELLHEMDPTDHEPRTREGASQEKNKHSVDKAPSALIHKVATMAAVKEVLLETLSCLSKEELLKFKWFLQFTCFQKSLPLIPWTDSMWADRAETVDVMVETYGQRSVEVSREVLMDVNRTDLVEFLSESTSGLKESSAETFHVKTTEEGSCSAVTQEVNAMAAIMDLLLETLADFGDSEIQDLKQKLDLFQHDLDFDWTLRPVEPADIQETVVVIVLTYGRQSVEKTKEVLEKMKRPELVKSLSDSSLTPQKASPADKQPSALIHKAATVAAVKHLILESLNQLNDEDFEKLKQSLQLMIRRSDKRRMETADKKKTVTVIMEEFGQRSVEETKKVLMDIGRADVVQRFLETSSGPTEKHSEHQEEPELFQREAERNAVKQNLWKMLQHSSDKELVQFHWLLRFIYFQKGLPQMRLGRRGYYKDGLVNQILELPDQQRLDVTMEILRDMNRSDLIERLTETISLLKGIVHSLKVPGGWTKLHPEVNHSPADDAPTYSLQSEAGSFECSVSGLRWVCEDKVSFKYQFCSWGGHMERMEVLHYMPAGPLIDITVVVGKVSEVHLPHWVYTGDDPAVLDEFAVLHVDDCGDAVEPASEVTSSHVKISEPNFFPRAALVKMFYHRKISCSVLIYYKPNTTFLKLHVYLVPRDPALEQVMNKNEASFGYKRIQKPHPDQYLQMEQQFTLTADIETAEIYPKKMTLRHDSDNPNFYEVFIENPDGDVHLSLSYSVAASEPVWSCKIRKDDYSHTRRLEAAGICSAVTSAHAVAEDADEHCSALIQQADQASPVKEKLLELVEELKEEELKRFKWHLKLSPMDKGLPIIPESQLEPADRLELVDLMVQVYCDRAVEVVNMVLQTIQRNDLVIGCQMR